MSDGKFFALKALGHIATAIAQLSVHEDEEGFDEESDNARRPRRRRPARSPRATSPVGKPKPCCLTKRSKE